MVKVASNVYPLPINPSLRRAVEMFYESDDDLTSWMAPCCLNTFTAGVVRTLSWELFLRKLHGAIQELDFASGRVSGHCG